MFRGIGYTRQRDDLPLEEIMGKSPMGKVAVVVDQARANQ
jgi:hypothetical protein